MRFTRPNSSESLLFGTGIELGVRHLRKRSARTIQPSNSKKSVRRWTGL